MSSATATTTKVCTSCNEEKPLDKFGVRRKVCFACDYATNKDVQAAWRAANPERVLEGQRRRRSSRVEAEREYQRQYRLQNRDRLREANREYSRANREKLRDRRRRYKYGLPEGEYARLFAEQDGLCVICGLPERARYRGELKPLAVDHDHATGVVRKLLCHQCNYGLGCFLENPDALEAAARYLREHA